jgi:hypothetical protein
MDGAAASQARLSTRTMPPARDPDRGLAIANDACEAALPSLPAGASADVLISDEERLLETADALLARAGVDRSEHMPKPERYQYVRRASTARTRRDLVRRFLAQKWSVKSHEAAVVKLNARPIVVMSPFGDDDRGGGNRHSPQRKSRDSRLHRYSGWCTVCQIQNEWCGFEHVDHSRSVLQPIPTYREVTKVAGAGAEDESEVARMRHKNKTKRNRKNKKKKTARFVGEDGMTEFEKRVKEKARLRRGKSRQNEVWVAGGQQRASTQLYNQHRVAHRMRLAGEMEYVQDWLQRYYYDSEAEDDEEGEEEDEGKQQGDVSDMQFQAEQTYRNMTAGGAKLAEWKEAWFKREQHERNGGVWTPNRFAFTLVLVAQDVAGFGMPESVAQAIYEHLDVRGSRLLGSEALVRAVEEVVVGGMVGGDSGVCSQKEGGQEEEEGEAEHDDDADDDVPVQ